MARRQRKTQMARKTNYGQLHHALGPQSVLSADNVAHIHDNAQRALQDLGISILLPEAREMLRTAGADVQDHMVYFPKDMVENALSTAPKRYTMRAPDPNKDQEIYLGRQLFASSGGCPNAYDRIRGRRPGDLESYREAIQLQQSFDIIHKLSPAPEPQDVPIHLRHLAMVETQIANADKALAIYARGRAQVDQMFELIQSALGVSDDEFRANPYCSTVINTNSPRLIDNPMAQGLIDFARAGQLTIVTPFCLAGAMAPITVAGALTLQHAEALAGITIAQTACVGAPVMYGGFGSNVDMKSGAPAFGTPTHMQMTLGSGQLARHIGLPWRSAAGTASNTHDMQGATENTMAIMATAMAHATLTLHTAGWLEGGLTFGYEKFINDIEVLQTLGHFSKGVDQSASAMSLDPIAEVMPGGHFFETGQTMERYGSEFYDPLIADLSNYGTWENAGAIPSQDRATALWQARLAKFTPPAGSAERLGRMSERLARMYETGGAPILD